MEVLIQALAGIGIGLAVWIAGSLLVALVLKRKRRQRKKKY